MDYRSFGSTGLRVSPIGLGCMTFGREIDEAASIPILRRALDAGINLFDTANVYGRGASEEIVGRALKDVRDRVVIASKFNGQMSDAPNDRGASRYHILNSVDASLRRLQTDRIDLYQIHRFDPDTPLEETLRALDDLVRAGKVRYIGCSNFAAWQVVKALWISDLEHWVRFVSMQPRYNLIFREPESDLLPMCASEGLAVIPYSPLAGGFLTGKYQPGAPPPPGSRLATAAWYQDVYAREKNYRVVTALDKYAQTRGVPKEQLALAWVMSHPAITAPIVGARTVAQLETALAAYALKMTPEERDAITKIADEA
ncbi:MAG: aldo/keto reductase [Chloroflexota bacterium]|nr:aldo/keto reductase [Chloroflexota bacterium]